MKAHCPHRWNWKKTPRLYSFFHVALCIVSVCFALSFLLVSEARAQEEEVLLLDAHTVVASPIIEGTVVSRYGVESTELSRSQLLDLNAQDITSALRRTPGVTIARFNPVGSFGGGAGGGIFIRGAGSSRPGGEVATLIDGVSIMNPVWGHPILDILPIDPAGSITVHKAAQPELFGNAHAAINITPLEMEEEGFTTRISGQYGTYNTIYESFTHGGKVGPLDYYVGQAYKSSAGHRSHSSGQLESYFGRVGYRLTDNWKASWFGVYSNNFAHDPGDRRRTLARNNGRYGTEDGLNIFTLRHEYDAASGYVKAYYNNGSADWDGEYSSPTATIDTDMNWESYGLTTRESMRLWDGGELLMGFAYDKSSGKQIGRYTDGQEKRFPRHSFESGSIFAAISHIFGSREGWYAIPSAGARQYWHSEFDSAVSPHAGLVLGYKETELHFSYSRSILYPNLNVAIMSEVISPPLVMNNPDGWKDLKPEIVDHFEAGISRSFNSVVKAEVTAFWDEGKDRYRMWSKSPSGMPPAGFANIDSFRKYGLEAAVTITPTETLSVYTGAAFLKTEPHDLPFAPDWTLTAGMNWRFLDDFKLSADAMYRSTMYSGTWSRGAGSATDGSKVKDAFVLNAKLSYFFSLPSVYVKEAEVFIAGENLTDTRYEYSPGYTMPGATCTVGLSLRF